MKLMKMNVTLIILSFMIILLCISNNKINSANLNKLEKTSEGSEESSKFNSESLMEMEKHKKKHKKAKNQLRTHSENQLHTTNDSWRNITYRILNDSFVIQDVHTFKTAHRTWDWKVIDRRLEDIYQDMRLNYEDRVTPKAIRSFLEIFVNQFQSCDADGDNLLNKIEFTGCMKNDTYLKTIIPPNMKYAGFVNYTYTNETGFYTTVFDILDTHHNQNLNFYDYMVMRLMAFSWRKCSVMAPFIDEVNFECSMKIATGYRTLSRSTLRNLYKLSLELTNNENIRNLDFVSFLLVASSTRLFAEINSKEDSDIIRTEFNLALDKNILPKRYNQDIINQFFHLIEEADRPHQGIDIHSFFFYDFFLRIFDEPKKLPFTKQRPFYLNQSEFEYTLSHYLFPKRCMDEIKKIPQNNLSYYSYKMFTYYNISQYDQESDFLLKSFVETDEKITYVNRNRFEGASKNLNGFRFKSKNNKMNNRLKIKNNDNILNYIGGNKNLEFSLTNTSLSIFNILDYKRISYIDFYDFATFIQVNYLFQQFDELHKGRIVAGDLLEKFTNYADFPVVNYKLRNRANKFNLLPQDIYVDLSTSLLVLRIDDLISSVVRRVDKTTLYEFELKNLFTFTNFRFVPDYIQNKCLRGTDKKNIPLYDWECAFTRSLIKNLEYFESSYAYLTSKNRNLTLVNTVFVNTDPQLN